MDMPTNGLGDTSAVGLRDSMLLLQTRQSRAGIRGSRASLAMQLPEPKGKAQIPQPRFLLLLPLLYPNRAQCCPKVTTAM